MKRKIDAERRVSNENLWLDKRWCTCHVWKSQRSYALMGKCDQMQMQCGALQGPFRALGKHVWQAGETTERNGRRRDDGEHFRSDGLSHRQFQHLWSR